MKFSFEKFNTSPKPIQNTEKVEREKTQEEFDQEILVEANKLKLSIPALLKDIDAYGGSEKFKEVMERKTISEVMTIDTWEPEKIKNLTDATESNDVSGKYAPATSIGRRIIGTLSQEKRSHEAEAKGSERIALALIGLVALEALGGVSLTEIKQHIGSGGIASSDLPLIISMATTGIASAVAKINAVTERIKERVAQRMVDTQKLKHKMAGVREG